MSNHLKDIIIYTYQHYPVPMQLGISRLMKLLFIGDWDCVKQFKAPLNDFQWTITPAGPFSAPVLDVLVNMKEHFDIRGKMEHWEGTDIVPEIVVIFKAEENYATNLENQVTDVLDRVIARTYEMNWQQLWQHMNTTTPISICEISKKVDLVDMLNSPSLFGTLVLPDTMTKSTAAVVASGAHAEKAEAKRLSLLKSRKLVSSRLTTN